MPNRLAAQTSPYLLQHAGNPVDWWPWGEEAFAEARRLDRPVLLSVGYSACHWCHVMAHESFENPQVAAVMNELFVNIKVDREERPDVDTVYMQAVEAMTGRGGWPMTVFLTPQAVPYYGGTYFPPEDRQGMRGFPVILRAAAAAYHTQRDEVARVGEQLRQAVTPPRLRGGEEPSVEQLDRAVQTLVEQTDRRLGGFGGAPKFPHPASVDLMLRRHATTRQPALLDAALISLDRMARGGIYDHVGGGFHRYSVDARWSVPHFEKMLYDNAQLAPVYLHAYQLTGDRRWRRVCEETLDYVAREMLLPQGGFASTQDADSEGEEGRFFVWTPEQLRDALGNDDAAAFAARVFGVTPGGNFEHGSTVLSLPYPLEQVATALDTTRDALQQRLDGIRATLYEVREQRVHPGRDDKVVTSWNAMMLAAFAEAGAALDRDDYVRIARDCATFLLRQVSRDGTPLRTWKDGEAKISGFLEDVAFLSDALLTLYEATGEPHWFAESQRLATDMLARFWDSVGGFYDTAIDAEPLLVRPQSLDDNAVPAGQSIAAHALLRLHAYTGDDRWRRTAHDVIAPLAEAVARGPLGLGNLGWALELLTAPVREVAVAGDHNAEDTKALVRTVTHRFDPLRVLAWGAPDGVPLRQDRPLVDGRAAAYVCRNFACERPVTSPDELAALLEARD
jgi:uncharacterized protein YyaL (SSP411 family)